MLSGAAMAPMSPVRRSLHSPRSLIRGASETSSRSLPCHRRRRRMRPASWPNHVIPIINREKEVRNKASPIILHTYTHMNTTTSHHRLSHHPFPLQQSSVSSEQKAVSTLHDFTRFTFVCVCVQMQCKTSTHFSIFLSACNPLFFLLPIWCEFFPFYFFQDWYDIKLFYFIFPHSVSLSLSFFLCVCVQCTSPIKWFHWRFTPFPMTSHHHHHRCHQLPSSHQYSKISSISSLL